MIALLAISVESSAVTIRSHWFALSSCWMSSGFAMSSSLSRLRRYGLFAAHAGLAARRREHAGLLEEGEHVARRPALDDPAAREPHEVAVGPDDLVARRL